MSGWTEVSTQEEFDEAVEAGRWVKVSEGHFHASDSASVTAFGSASVRASDSASVRAYDTASVRAYDSASVTASGSASVRAFGSASVTASGSASVTAFGSASVRAYDSASVTAFGSASVRAYDSASVTAYDSASVRAYDSASVTAYDTASVRAYDTASVTAYDTASVRAYGSASVDASKYVGVTVHDDQVQVVEGTHVIRVPEVTSVEGWLEYVGTPVDDGHVVLFKGVDDTLTAGHRWTPTVYEPGTVVVAEDWDPREVCGGGLHLCARPHETGQYIDATRYVACRVDVSDLVLVEPGHDVPDKVKSRRVECLYEVDVDGVRVSS